MNENLTNNSVCPNCGNANSSNTKFCIRCGNRLQPQTVENNNFNYQQENITQTINPEQHINSVPAQNNFNMEQSVSPASTQNNNVGIVQGVSPVPPQNNNVNIEQNIYQQTTNNYSTSNNETINNNATENLNYVEYIIGTILKPYDKFKKEETKLNDAKDVSILTLIVIGAMTILGLLQTMLSAVRVESIWSGEVEWVWENLKEIEYVKVLGQSLLMYGGILIAISGIYFLASLVIKKETKFIKLLSAATTAFIPFAIGTSLISPLISMVYAPLGICVTIISFIYTLIILNELINDIIKIEDKNTRIYFHVICLSILIIGGGFIAYKLILGSLTSGFGSLSGLF